MTLPLADLRREYTRASLDASDVSHDPFAQFSLWMDQALKAGVAEGTAMSLSTVKADGRPASRIVLLKGFDHQGLVFYTNYDSAKGRELLEHPFAAALLYWTELERQVRIEGRIERVSAAESDAYYAIRPLGSRIGAWASPQSEVVPDRASLEQRFSEAEARHGEAPPRPAHWGGYRLVPDRFEFWQGRPNRLHDRIVYRTAGGQWQIERLAP
jgi:pyridoxamine 5'-phosphate oxidase